MGRGKGMGGALSTQCYSGGKEEGGQGESDTAEEKRREGEHGTSHHQGRNNQGLHRATLHARARTSFEMTTTAPSILAKWGTKDRNRGHRGTCAYASLLICV